MSGPTVNALADTFRRPHPPRRPGAPARRRSRHRSCSRPFPESPAAVRCRIGGPHRFQKRIRRPRRDLTRRIGGDRCSLAIAAFPAPEIVGMAPEIVGMAGPAAPGARSCAPRSRRPRRFPPPASPRAAACHAARSPHDRLPLPPSEAGSRSPAASCSSRLRMVAPYRHRSDRIQRCQFTPAWSRSAIARPTKSLPTAYGSGRHRSRRASPWVARRGEAANVGVAGRCPRRHVAWVSAASSADFGVRDGWSEADGDALFRHPPDEQGTMMRRRCSTAPGGDAAAAVPVRGEPG